MMDGVESALARLLFAIPALRRRRVRRGLLGGHGMRGSAQSTTRLSSRTGALRTASNRHAMDFWAGSPTGMPVTFRVAFKPTASIESLSAL
jgi:chorismate synthase